MSIPTAPRWLIGSGLVLICMGVFHLLAWPILGGSWEGAVSIRKPILFGISTGITLVSLGWIQAKLKPTFYDVLLSAVVGPALVIEVSLIAMQFWRNQPSHFNHGSALDGGVDYAITGLIFVATMAIVDLTRRCFQFLNTSQEMKTAIIGGMIFLLISCGLGFFIMGLGEYQSRQGLSPEIFGKSGVLKFPHGTAIHAVQFFPIMVWVATQLSVPQTKRLRSVQWAIVAMSLFLFYSLLQTFRGRARFDLDLASGALLMATVVACIASALLVVWPVVNRWRSTAGSDR